MFTKIYSGAVCGIEGKLISVEADVSDGFPTCIFVGYLASEVKEARERVTAALKNSGYLLPAKKIIVNLSPAGMRKQGTAYDLPIALSLLGSLGIIPQEKLKSVFAVGELSLDGTVRPVKGILPLIMMAQQQGFKRCYVPAQNVREAHLADKSGKPEISIIGITDLHSACAHFLDEPSLGRIAGSAGDEQQQPDMKLVYDTKQPEEVQGVGDFAEIIGQERLKRAIVVAVSGMHHFLMIGPPGSGKSMSAKAIQGILPPMSFEESLEVTRLYSVAGILGTNCALVTRRPFRSPHHTVTVKAMTGGGRIASPGEISLAHRGILFLDELAEFPPAVLEILRQPLEEGIITINRLQGSDVFPARFMLVAAMNPCKCGYYPDRSRCQCSPQEVHHYLHRISRPLWNRIDVCVEVQQPQQADIRQYIRKTGAIFNKKEQVFDGGLTSRSMAQMVSRARKIQEQRFLGAGIHFNSEMTAAHIRRYCPMSDAVEAYADRLCAMLELTMRGRHKLLKVARTIADLDEKEELLEKHLDEASAYRMIEASYWEN